MAAEEPTQAAAPAVHPTGIDAYRPDEIARRIETAGVSKTRLPLVSLVALGCLAGAFISFGALFYLAVLAGADPGHGPTRLAAGIAFSLGLILVVVGGAELFTGNTLIVMAWVNKRVGTARWRATGARACWPTWPVPWRSARWRCCPDCMKGRWGRWRCGVAAGKFQLSVTRAGGARHSLQRAGLPGRVAQLRGA